MTRPSQMAKELDFHIENLEGRLKKVDEICTKNEAFLIDYFDNYYNPHVNQSRFTSEHDSVCQDLEKLADYLLYMDSKEEREKQDSERSLLSNKNNDTNKKKEFLTDDFIIVEDKIKVERSTKKYGKIKVTREDREQYSELKDSGKTINALLEVIATGVNCDGIKVTEEHMRKIRWFLIELRKDEVTFKEQTKRYINFKRLDPETTVIDYDNDSGYVDEKGEYVVISENKFEFTEPTHIYELIEHYGMLKEYTYEKTTSDMKHILLTLEFLIDHAELTDYMRDIIIWKIDGLSGRDIIEGIENKYGLSFSEQRLSQIYNTTIPNLIVDAYNDTYEEWLYTYKVKGTYKTCTNCGKAKLAKTKHFHKDSKGKLGLRAKCKKCYSSQSLN